MLKIRNKLLDRLHHLRLGEVLFLEDAFQLVEEPIHLSHFMASGLADHAQGSEALHVNLLTWNEKFLIINYFNLLDVGNESIYD